MAIDPQGTENLTTRKGRVFATENFATVDGPGIRYVVFFQGCVLKCIYCHNPESRCLKGGKWVQAGEVLDDIMRYKNFMTNSSGGVTLSGGEPLVQPKFAAALLTLAKAQGLHTAVDTAGSIPWKIAAPVVELSDLVLLDIKAGSHDQARKIAALDIEILEEFITGLNSLNKAVWVRHVLVPGWNDSREQLEDVSRMTNRIKNLQRFDVLPFHQMGKDKWEALKLPYLLTDQPDATSEQIYRAQKILGIKDQLN